jgi:DNA-binding SARP family transcriptional activator
MHLTTLGHLELRSGGQVLLARRRKELTLLAVLAQRAPAPIARSELAGLIWEGRDASRARHSLRQALSDLHRTLGDRLLVSTEEVALADGAVTLDATQFLAACGREEWDVAVSLWQGDFLGDVADLEGVALARWVEDSRAALRAALSTACARRCADAEARGRWPAAVAHAEAWLRHDAGNADARMHLAAVLRAVGRRSEADRLDGLERDATIGLREADFVGRDGAFELLAQAWNGARAGDWRVVVLRGEPGSGRSRLLREFARLVRERWPRASVTRIGEPQAAGAPALVLADVPAAPASAEAVAQLLTRAPGGTLLVIAPERVGPLRKVPSAIYLDLEPLSLDDTRRVARSMVPLPARLLDALARRLHADTGGHPADLVRAVTLLVSEGMIVHDPATGWTTTPGVAIAPLAIDDPRERTRRRLGRMRAESRRAVDAAAVLGIAASRELIAAVGALEGLALDAALTEATGRKLLRVGTDGRYRFYTAVVRDAVYGLIPEARVRSLHRSAARALRRAARDDARLRTELQRHREVAGLGFARPWPFRLAAVIAQGLGVRG